MSSEGLIHVSAGRFCFVHTNFVSTAAGGVVIRTPNGQEFRTVCKECATRDGVEWPAVVTEQWAANPDAEAELWVDRPSPDEIIGVLRARQPIRWHNIK